MRPLRQKDAFGVTEERIPPRGDKGEQKDDDRKAYEDSKETKWNNKRTQGNDA